MRRFVVYPDNMLDDMSQVLCREEPCYLHSIIWIVCGIFIGIAFFVCFGKVDDVVKADGIVRPVMNVSTVSNITSGEIEFLFYKPGDFVKSGDKLFSIKNESLVAQKKSIELQLKENCGKLMGLSVLLKSYENNSEEIETDNSTVRARFDSFVAEKKLLSARISRTGDLLAEEMKLPESSTTVSEIEKRRYDYSISVMEYEQFCADFYSSLKQEMDALKLEDGELKKQVVQVNESLKNLVLVSPVDGFVQEKSSLNVGDYIFADQQVLNIIPSSDTNCRIELHVPAENMGKLEKGQRVKLRFPAFPFSEFKGIDGELTVIQPDSEVSDSGFLYFTVYASADSMELKNKKGLCYQIKPGFEVNARIVLENQTLFYFLLKKLDFTV